MIIKVCGMRDPDNIKAVAKTGIDWMGMIFYEKSPRYVGMRPSDAGITPDYAMEAADAIPEGIKRVGVFVDAMAQTIIAKTVAYRLDIIQLHGNETPTLLRNLRLTLMPEDGRTRIAGVSQDLKLMKVISVESAADLEKCRQYEDCADYLLFDTKCKERGGSGKQFDWTAVDAYDGALPFILSGGIGPGDEERLRAISNDRLMGIDLNSRFETSPAIKDAAAIAKFVDNMRQQ